MYLKKVRKLHRNTSLIRNIWYRNPILFYGLALPFVVVAATSLKAAVILSCVLATCTIPTMLLLRTFAKYIPFWVRIIGTTTIAMLFVTFAMFIISKFDLAILDALGMYLPLLALNTILIAQTHSYCEKESLLGVFTSISINCVAFAIVTCLIGGVRELFGNGTLWGNSIAISVKIPALLIPFSGFLLLGFLSAGVNGLNRLSNSLLMLSEKKELEMKKLKRQARKEHLMRGSS